MSHLITEARKALRAAQTMQENTRLPEEADAWEQERRLLELVAESMNHRLNARNERARAQLEIAP